MEKMINVINDNLTSVITGIREHKEDLQQTLERIKNNMSEKVREANYYKDEVENSRVIISTLEEEITNLENDLAELNHKFNSKDFKEILNAGNKEINAKIVEKRNLISEQGKKIIDLTDKAKTLKDELITLKEKKNITEENLEKTIVLERYYSIRINEIIDYSIANVNDLDSYMKEIPQENLDVTDDYSDVDINQVVDGTVFEEIDEISSSEPDEDLLASVLANPSAIESKPVEKEVEEEKKEVEEAPKVVDEYEFPMTDKLEDMITEAKSIIAKNSSLVNVDKIEDEDVSGNEMADLVQDIVDEEKTNKKFPDGEVSKNYVQAAIDFDDDGPFVMKTPVVPIENTVKLDEEAKEENPVVEEEKIEDLEKDIQEAVSFDDKEDLDIDADSLEKVNDDNDELDEDEDVIDIFVDEDEDKPFDSKLVIDLDGNVIKADEENNESVRELHERLHSDRMSEGDNLEKEVVEEQTLPTVDETITPVVEEQVIPVVESSVMDVIKDEPMADLNAPDTYTSMDVVEDKINQGYENIVASVQNDINNSLELDSDENIIDETSFEFIDQDNFEEALKDAGLDKNLFEADDLILLQTGFDKDNAKRILDIMNKYNLDVNNIYKNARLLMYVSPENLDKLINLLITSGASSKDVDMLFNCFDRVNLGKFEQEIMTSSDPILTQILFDSLPVESNEVIGNVLGLSIQDVNILKKNAKDDDYAIMNMFPNIVKANYDELKNLNIENLNECITKHPHRFTMVPSKFHDILDKYDTEDLIRCINKNSAVIDKL